jgi:adenylate cyclase
MPTRRRPTVVQLFIATTLVLALAVGAIVSVFFESSRRSILETSDKLRDAAARRIAGRIATELREASDALQNVERSARLGAVDLGEPRALETRLFTELVAHPTLSEMTLTHATLRGYDDAGEAQLEPGDRWQISVFRATADPASAVITRRVVFESGAYAVDLRQRPPGGGLFGTPLRRAADAAPDPTGHDTFREPVSRDSYGKALFSDLSFSELDAALPQERQRVVVTALRALEDAPGRFAGVLRVGLLAENVDRLPGVESGESQQVILCDPKGRLVARLDPRDRVISVGGELRVAPARLPPSIAAALASPRLGRLSADRLEATDRLVVGSSAFLATFLRLPQSQEWIVGVVVPEDFYTRDLRALRDRFLAVVAAVTAIVLLAGGVVLLAVRRSLARVVGATSRMRTFDFAPSSTDASLREVSEVMEGLERAKTALRALGRYVPIDLVRQLYESNREPELGGELRNLTLMFSDIKGFTSLSEQLAPDVLALALGRYLKAMTDGVRAAGGTVDKFIGDSVMAFWNAPSPCLDHPRRACAAVVACMQRTRDLFASPEWRGMAPLYTRFGVHTARVMVGHFGAPDRLSYTALGDGVNLASRLEGLCKQYGVAAMASEAVVEAAREEFAFRLLDKVAVSGKREAVRVYELLGRRADSSEARWAEAKLYEDALARYFGRDFAGALEVLVACDGDPPSRVLALRCRAMLAHPPPAEWDGVYIATSK